jgi:hypothetical protein
MLHQLLVFLLSRAQIPPQYAENITVYHVNPNAYGVAPYNMNTADVLGDMYFDMRSVGLPIECASNSSKAASDCDNAEVVGSDLVITKLVLEIDSRVGAYGRCNVCVNGSDHHGNNSCTDGVYDCACGGYVHSTPCGAAVGVKNISDHVHGHDCREGDPNWECWRDAVGHKTGGFWYSTFGDGYCGDGTAPAPAGCTWRVAEFVKRVNKTCSDNAVYGEVEKVDAQAADSCFSKCADSVVGPMRNTSSVCWVTCFYNTVIGPAASKPGGAVAGMPLADLTTAWGLPFDSTDPAKGGCPALDPPSM